MGVFENNFKFQRLVYALLIGIITAGLLYAVFFAAFIRVSEIEILGNKNITNKEITNAIEAHAHKRLLLLFPRNSFFLFPSGAIAQDLRNQFPLIDDILIEKDFPRHVRLTIAEKEPIVIWVTKSAWYLVDILGRVTSEITPVEAKSIQLPIIIDELDQTFRPREKIVSPELVTFTTKMSDLIPQKTILKVKEIRVPSAAASEVHVITQDGFAIYFDPTRDPEDQVLILNDLLTKEIKDKRKSLQYIDMRIENWAYYK